MSHQPAHARPRDPKVVRFWLVIGAILAVVALGYGGYAVGTSVVSQPTHTVTHTHVVPVPVPAHCPHAKPIPHKSDASSQIRHDAHLRHLAHLRILHHLHELHMQHLRDIGVQVE